ncbi:cache domain-containing protein [Leucothrix arctica]|nr:cache domain-containing protein [Leucothrix arctica]
MSNQIRDIGIQSAGKEVLAGHKSELKDIVDVMASTLAAATEGMTDKDEIYKTYSTLSKGARFLPDKSGYFFIYEGGVNFFHPIKPELEGKDLTNLKDANGFLLIQALDEAAKSGGGFVEYYWDKPGKGNQPKLSYISMIPKSSYSIGTGVYIDDIKEKEAAIFTTMNDFSNSFLVKWSVVLLLAFFVIILPVIIYMIKSMTSPLVRLTEVASEYSRGALDSEIEYTDRKDEIGALSRAIKRLGSSTRIVMKKLEETNVK